jgi:hypothetical protein
MLKHYLTAALVVLSLASGSAVANAAAIAHRHNPQVQINEGGFYGYAESQAGYGYYWDPYTWSTGNGYY